MKRLLSSLALATVLAVPTAQAADWSGPYVGAMFSSETGHQVYSDEGEYDLEGTTYGAFTGYNAQSGNMVYGGEIAYSAGGAADPDDLDYTFTHFVDLKGRVGYDAGGSLVYGILGWSIGEWDESGYLASASGYNAGVGIEFPITDSFFVGGEFLYRDVSGQWSADPDDTHNVTMQSLQVRVGMNF